MKTILTRMGLLFSIATMGVSCTTAYDSSGRPQEVLTPEGALLGAAALGITAYAIGKNNRSKRYHRNHYSGGQYGHGHHRDYRSSNYYGGHRGYRGYGGGGCPSY